MSYLKSLREMNSPPNLYDLLILLIIDPIIFIVQTQVLLLYFCSDPSSDSDSVLVLTLSNINL